MIRIGCGNNYNMAFYKMMLNEIFISVSSERFGGIANQNLVSLYRLVVNILPFQTMRHFIVLIVGFIFAGDGAGGKVFCII